MTLRVICGLVLFMPALQLAQAQQELKVTQLNVFKNGTYFITKEGNMELNNGVGKLQLPKNPLLGTFWLASPKDIAINKVVFIMDTLKKNHQARGLTDLLIANKGKRVRLTYRHDDKSMAELAGVIQDYFLISGLVKLKAVDGKTHYFPANEVKYLSVEDTPQESYQADSTVYLARLEMNRSPKDCRIKMVYMQSGIQWFPSYNIKILNEKELQLELKALVENFAEQIQDARLTLTVGDPNYKYGQSVEQFANPYLTPMNSGINYNPYATYQFQNRPMAGVESVMLASKQGADAFNDYQTYETGAEKTGDLYMYDLGKLSIPRNSKVAFQIFSQVIPYKSIYKTSLNDYSNFHASQQINNDPDRKFEVYHSLSLTNLTKDPFTRAPVFVMDEELRPLAQDEIVYTPLNASVSVNLSRSPDIIVKNTEEEKGREERARTFDRQVFTKVILVGSIELHNTLNKRIILSIDKKVNGLITAAGDGGKITRLSGGNALNPLSTAIWEIELANNEKRLINYTYEVYIQVY